QTRWVCARLREAHDSLEIEEIIIKTHGDTATGQRFDADWPVGGFVGAIERELAGGRIDLAVHSYKDLPTTSTPGLVIAAVPPREAVHDVLVTSERVALDDLPPGFRIGTSSPRRAAQLRRLADVKIVEIRGNVPTRVAKVSGDAVDGVVVAAAGLRRLGITPRHVVDLPADRFLPAPAQGALAVQARNDDEAASLAAVLHDEPSGNTVAAERSFLEAIQAGCHTPVAALATLTDGVLSLRGQLFSDDGTRLAEGTESGDDAPAVGGRLARRLMDELRRPA
ncbi:MAG: hydroxymethylbilane synthase, partial [Phycisphaerae bacterium]